MSVNAPQENIQNTGIYTPSEEDRNLDTLVRITGMKKTSDSEDLEILYLQEFTTIEKMEQAAVEDGVCTKEQVEQKTCLNDPFYIRTTNNTSKLALDQNAKVVIYARSEDGSYLTQEGSSDAYMIQISPTEFSSKYSQREYLKDQPFYILIQNDKIVALLEKYIP